MVIGPLAIGPLAPGPCSKYACSMWFRGRDESPPASKAEYYVGVPVNGMCLYGCMLLIAH